MTDHPLPPSGKSDAIASYAAARQKIRIGQLGGPDTLMQALTLDPMLGPAHLRYLLYRGCGYNIPAEQRAAYTQAMALASSLDARDRSLLPLAQLVIDGKEEPLLAELRRLEDAAPGDGELPILHECYARTFHRFDEADAAERRALDLDPRATEVLYHHARYARGDEAKALVDRCLAISPDASACLYWRAFALRGDSGDCAGALADARRLVDIEPENAWSYAALAEGLAATNAPLDAIKDALAKMERWLVPNKFVRPHIGEVELAVFEGDFRRADALAVGLEASLADSSSEDLHDEIAALRISLALESGDRARALDEADKFERESSAWDERSPGGVRLWRVFLRHQAHLVGDAEFEKERSRLIAEDIAAEKTSREMRAHFVSQAASRFAETAREAAVAILPDGGLPEDGHHLLLLGHADAAVPLLKEVTNTCRAITPPPQFGVSGIVAFVQIQHQRLDLAEALERTGDRAGACRTYASIAQAWRDARPRSVTAERARARIAALACDAR
jgi:tetratricopeptide (TPR) repeat protein